MSHWSGRTSSMSHESDGGGDALSSSGGGLGDSIARESDNILFAMDDIGGPAPDSATGDELAPLSSTSSSGSGGDDAAGASGSGGALLANVATSPLARSYEPTRPRKRHGAESMSAAADDDSNGGDAGGTRAVAGPRVVRRPRAHTGTKRSHAPDNRLWQSSDLPLAAGGGSSAASGDIAGELATVASLARSPEGPPPLNFTFGSAPAGSMLYETHASRLASEIDEEELVGSLPKSKQRRRTRNMDELSELVPGLLTVANFLKTHKCFEMVPDSGKVVVLEARITLLDALIAMSENDLFSAAVWHANKHKFVGLMSPLQLLDVMVHSRAQLLRDDDRARPAAAAFNVTPVLRNALRAAVHADGVPRLPSVPEVSADVPDVAISQALSECTIERWLDTLAPLRVAPAPAAPAPPTIGSPLLQRRAAKRGLWYLDPDDTLWEAARALLASTDSKLPLVERESHSTLCIVTLSRLLTSLYRGLTPLPPLLMRSIELLGVGSFVAIDDKEQPCGHVSPRVGAAPSGPPAALIDTTLGYALALMADHRTQALPLLSRDGKPVDLLAAADVPALFRMATDAARGLDTPTSGTEATAVDADDGQDGADDAQDSAADMEKDTADSETKSASLLSMPCVQVVSRIENRTGNGALLTCERSASLASVLQSLVENRVHQLVVVDERGLYSGIITARDVVRFLCRSL